MKQKRKRRLFSRLDLDSKCTLGVRGRCGTLDRLLREAESPSQGLFSRRPSILSRFGRKTNGISQPRCAKPARYRKAAVASPAKLRGPHGHSPVYGARVDGGEDITWRGKRARWRPGLTRPDSARILKPLHSRTERGISDSRRSLGGSVCKNVGKGGRADGQVRVCGL